MDRIWLNHYPDGVPADIDPQAWPSLVALIDDALARHAARTAYVSQGRRMSYAELDRLADAFAAWLQRRGVVKGTRVALMMPNLLQYPVCLIGALRAGAVVVNCNPLYTPRELEHQLRDSGAEVIVIVENFAHTLEQVLPRTALKTVVVTSIGEMLGTLKGVLVDFVVRRVKKMVPPWSLPGALRLSQALSQTRGQRPVPVALGPADLAFLQYTGGTTGVSKGAMLTHRNISANVLQASAWLRPAVREGEELVVTALPLYHVFALTANCLAFLVFGAANLLILNPRDIPGFVRELGRHRFSAITGVNTLFNALLNHPDFAKLDFSALRIALGGGMAVQQAVAERWQKVTGVAIAQAYGLTETSPAVTINPLDTRRFTGSIGLPVPSTELSVRDDEGRELAPGEIGEICVRGPQVTPGYWQQPAETAKIFFPDGFLRTGDVGYVAPDGHVFLVDRKKDMILVSGFNVYPNEVEDVIAKHPGVLEAAVVGVPDPRSGERVKLVVVRRDPALTAEALLAFARAELTGYKVPQIVEFRDVLPKTNVGKVLRRELREPA
ncbi:AMP-binding protein [Caldimonas tepidiphila]|uniref:AMP-binding protein n=1 Tax=Caldimonas tepidiphila TaxID=2315841 RepID=UPI000E5B941B|nr:AMP-binding protein [Caldimonas tepidiphila]